jgi:hypothetical protein
MAQKTDLYSILISYANKNNSPYIEIDPVIGFIEKYAKQVSTRLPEWLKWTQNVSVKFWSEISGLVEAGKCELLSDTPEGRIYMSLFYVDLLRKYYGDIDNKADIPFPNEESLKIIIPESQKKHLNVGDDFSGYLEHPEEGIPPIVQIGFPDDFGTGLFLSFMIPKPLIDTCLLKVRFYLESHGNKEYALRKLSPQFQKRESYLRDMLNNIVIRPTDCIRAMEEGEDFAYVFWAHFCILVKNDIRKKKEYLNEDVAAVQAVCFLESFNSYYRARAVKRREKDLAFRELELSLEKPPFLYTMDQILGFTGSKGALLLGQYSRDELDEWVQKTVTETTGKGLPGLLIISGPHKERWFVSKSKLLLLCARLLEEARDIVKDAVSKRWIKLIREYRREPAMDNDKDFENLLIRYTGRLHPALTAVLKDPKLQLVYDELEKTQGIPVSSRIFVKGVMVPYSTLLLLKRKDLIADTRILLPFWYSMPILSSLIAFFKGLWKKKPAKKDGQDSIDDEEQELAAEKEGAGELRNAARAIAAVLVPPNHSLETYLEELENRWIRLINKKARADLVEDVKSLVRDNLRQTLRVQKHFKVTHETLSTLAANIVNRTPSLQELSGKDSLFLYVELYLVKLMQNMKV